MRHDVKEKLHTKRTSYVRTTGGIFRCFPSHNYWNHTWAKPNFPFLYFILGHNWSARQRRLYSEPHEYNTQDNISSMGRNCSAGFLHNRQSTIIVETNAERGDYGRNPDEIFQNAPRPSCMCRPQACFEENGLSYIGKSSQGVWSLKSSHGYLACYTTVVTTWTRPWTRPSFNFFFFFFDFPWLDRACPSAGNAPLQPTSKIW